MDLDHAAADHAAWATRLRDALEQPGRFDTGELASAERCAFGHWLAGEGRTRHGRLAAWRSCLQAHADFHRAAGSVASAINRGDPAAAQAMLGAGTPFAGAARAVEGAIAALQREAGASRPESAQPAVAAPTIERV